MSRTKVYRKNRGGALRAVLIFIVVLVLIAIIGCGGAYIMGWQMTGEPNPANWSIFKGDNKPDNAVIAVSSDGAELTDGSECATGGGITYFSARTLDNQVYIPAGEITLTATLSNEYINGAFDWAATWADPAATWAQDKNPLDYVSVTPTEDGSASATLHFLAVFSEQILITSTLRGTTSADTSTVDCVRQATISRPTVCFSDFDDPADYEADVELSDGTVTGDFTFNAVTTRVTDDFLNAFKNFLTFNVTTKTFVSANLPATCLSATYLSTTSEYYLQYADLIQDFDSYDQAHKEAIYYAWYQAYKLHTNNVLIDCKITYSYKGVSLTTFAESDYGGASAYALFCIQGSNFGSEIAPNVTLNKNVVF